MKINKIPGIAGAMALALFALANTSDAQRVTAKSVTDAELQAQIDAMRIGFGNNAPGLPPMPPLPTLEQLKTIRAKAALRRMSPMSPSPMAPSPQPQPPTYVPIDLGALNGSSSFAESINSNAQVVGRYTVSGVNHAFLWSGGSLMQDLGVLAGYSQSEAKQINASGQTVGFVGSGSSTQAFLYSGNSLQGLGGTSVAWAINTKGQICGYAYTNGVQHAVLWNSGVLKDLGTFGGDSSAAYAINDIGQVAGNIVTGSITRAYLYSGSSPQDIGTIGGNNSATESMNNAGQIVGFSETTTTGVYHAFLFSDNSIQDIDTLNSPNSAAFGINNNGWVVGGYTTNNNGHGFVYIGKQMYDLNALLINPNSGWTLVDATAINDAGQIVGYGSNPSGQYHAFLLNPLPNGAPPASSTVRTSLPTYGICPAPQEGQDSLVVITHGWINPSIETVQQAIDSVNSMSNAIVQYLNAHSLNNWKVLGWMWTNEAYIPLYIGGPATALHNSHQQGKILGDCIVSQGNWTRIHFIAHSAGAGLIQTATEDIRATSPNSANITIQCTFLDAYDGALLEYIPEYGYGANWSDSYFSRDLLTGAATQQPLLHAYNVDVTTLDEQATVSQLNEYVSSSDPSVPCLVTESSHGWPIDFYMNTITGGVFPPVYRGSYYDGFGFPLSEEANTFAFATNQYPRGNGSFGNSVPTTILGPEDPTCVPYVFSSGYAGSVADFTSASSTIQSITGTLQKFLGSVKPGTDSPVWVATVITDTNSLNSVSFYAQFTSATGAHGLLSVYWDTNMIGLVDEAAVQPGLQYYSLSFPSTVANTSHVLGFHLDPFTSVHSTMTITNIVTGCTGVSQPFSLSVTTNKSNGLIVYQLLGQPAMYTVQSSTDLLNWTNIAVLANTNGSVNFVDPTSTNNSFCFYRVTAP
jgi:probable HAF family extracellular repeat protein